MQYYRQNMELNGVLNNYPSVEICMKLIQQTNASGYIDSLERRRVCSCVLTLNTWCNLPIASNKPTLRRLESYVGFTSHRPYRALVLQTHHQGAHVSCGLVVNYDHGFLLRDGSYIIAPLRDCQWGKKTETSLIIHNRSALEIHLGVLKRPQFYFFFLEPSSLM